MSNGVVVAVIATAFVAGVGGGWLLRCPSGQPPAEAPSQVAEEKPGENANKNLRTLELWPQGKASTGSPVRVEYSAERFEPPAEIRDVPRSGWKRDTVLQAFAGAYSANRTGDGEALVSVFAPSEHGTLRARMDEESLARNKSYFESVREERLVEIVHYGEFRIAISRSTMQDGTKITRDTPFEQIDGEWWVTNRLASDMVFNHVLEGIKEAYRE